LERTKLKRNPSEEVGVEEGLEEGVHVARRALVPQPHVLLLLPFFRLRRSRQRHSPTGKVIRVDYKKFRKNEKLKKKKWEI
jgi:hypothetical protein